MTANAFGLLLVEREARMSLNPFLGVNRSMKKANSGRSRWVSIHN